MLNPGNPQIAPAEAPGALHLPVKTANLPFALLHAKVAVISFRGEDSDRFVLRIIVSTGNWTRQTLEESLDLAWHLDIVGRDTNNNVAPQDRTDLAAAWNFLSCSSNSSIFAPSNAFQGKTTSRPMLQPNLPHGLARLPNARRSTLPLLRQSERSLFEQLPDLVRHHGGNARRNYLALGSGFFEGEGAHDTFIPEQICETLKEKSLVTMSCEKSLFVNPLACQAVAARQSWIEAKAGPYTLPACRPTLAPSRALSTPNSSSVPIGAKSLTIAAALGSISGPAT